MEGVFPTYSYVQPVCQKEYVQGIFITNHSPAFESGDFTLPPPPPPLPSLSSGSSSYALLHLLLSPGTESSTSRPKASFIPNLAVSFNSGARYINPNTILKYSRILSASSGTYWYMHGLHTIYPFLRYCGIGNEAGKRRMGKGRGCDSVRSVFL